MLGSTYLEILRDDLTNIIINTSMQFSKNNLTLNFVFLVVALNLLVLHTSSMRQLRKFTCA